MIGSNVGPTRAALELSWHLIPVRPGFFDENELPRIIRSVTQLLKQSVRHRCPVFSGENAYGQG